MKKIEVGVAIFLGFILLAVAGVFIFLKTKEGPLQKPVAEEKKSEIQKTVLAENGFGDLQKIMSQEESAGNASLSAPTEKSVSSSSGRGGMDAVAIYPPGPQLDDYQLVYVGGDFKMPSDKVQVLKRKKGKESKDNFWENFLQNFHQMETLNFSSFENLAVSNFNFYEDKEFGLNFSLDLENSSLYIGAQWDKWPNFNQQCGGDQACYEKNRLTKNDRLADEEYLKMADEFLEKIALNKDNYEAGVVDQQNYLSSSNAFIPEIVVVFYQQRIENQKVFDQSGNPDGLRVEIDVRQKKVRGASPITNSVFLASAYPAEENQARIIEIAENGGWKRSGERVLKTESSLSNEGAADYQEPEYPFEEKPKKKEIKLGQPKLGLIKVYNYQEGTGQNDELFIPAFIFPILEQGENFWPKNIIVPAVKESQN